MSLASKLAEERRARLAAERMLELKQSELFAANRKLGLQARALQGEVVETRAQISSVQNENKRVKQELGVANHKVEVAERRLWHSIETITDGFAYFNADNEMIAANQAWLVIFDGLEMIRPGVNYVTILQLLTEEGIVNTGALAPADWRQMMLERWMMPQPEAVTVRLWNDEYIKLLDRRGPSGDIVSLGLNITETVEYEKQLKRARAEAEGANRAKTAFLANMSHEIRTPMNGVVGMADLLVETELNEEQELYVNTIRNSGEALLVIINDVLDYSKIEADRLQLHPEPFDLERCVHEVMLLLQPSARDKGIDLLVDYDLFLPTGFVGDPGRIRQVMTNLVGNAVKFTSEGYVLVRITGLPDAGDGRAQVNISIEDTGIGIPEDKIQHIFGEFNQVENERNRQFDGTGLGLAISRRLVDLMGGEIWVTSDEGKGSCFGFAVEMPLLDEDPRPHPDIPAGLRKVMVVGGLEANRQILEHQLLQLGLGVTHCASGREALAAISDEIDLIITDHNMSEMDGLELAEAMRGAGHGMPIIMLSANPAFANNDPARQYLHAILQKPVPRQELFRRLEGLGPALEASDVHAPQSETSADADEVPQAPEAGMADEPDRVSEQAEAAGPMMFTSFRNRDADADGDMDGGADEVTSEQMPDAEPDEIVFSRTPSVPIVTDPAPLADPEPSPSDPEQVVEPSAEIKTDADPILSEPSGTRSSPENPTEVEGPAAFSLMATPDDARAAPGDGQADLPEEADAAAPTPEMPPNEPVSDGEAPMQTDAPPEPSQSVPAQDLSDTPFESAVSDQTTDALEAVTIALPSVEDLGAALEALDPSMGEDANPVPEPQPTETDIKDTAEPPGPESPRQETEGAIEPETALLADPPDTPVAAPSRAMRILAAEDNKTNQLVFRKLVKSLDIELQFANNGLEAVDLFQSFVPDLIFMDISMPKMDGKEATQAIRALEAETGAHVPIVALTAHAMDGDDQGILAAGLDDYLTKPLRKPLIFGKIDECCPQDARPPLPAPLAATG